MAIELKTPAESRVLLDVYTETEVDVLLGAKAPINNPTFTGTVAGVTAAMVGLPNVDNTADADKPVSGPQAAAVAAVDQRLASIELTTSSIIDPWAPLWLMEAAVDDAGDIVGYLKSDGFWYPQAETGFYYLTDPWAPNWLVSLTVDENSNIMEWLRTNGQRLPAPTTGSVAASSTVGQAASLIKLAAARKTVLDPGDIPTITGPVTPNPGTHPIAHAYTSGSAKYRIYGGNAEAIAQGSVTDCFIVRSRPAYTSGGAVNRGGFEFFTDAPSLVLQNAYTSADGVSGRIFVDGLLAGQLGYISGERNWHTLTFSGGRKIRRIRYVPDTGNVNAFWGIYTDALSVVYAPPAPPIRVAWQGDSYAEGAVVGGENINGYTYLLTNKLGWDDGWIVAMGGTGFTADGSANDRPTYIERLTDVTDIAPDILVINLTVNDAAESPAAIGAAVTNYLVAVRSALPNLFVIVTGMASAALGPTQNILDIEAATATAVNDFGDESVVFIPVSTDPAGPWIYGTGWGNSTNNSGNSDLYIGLSGSSDNTHPNIAGHEYLSLRLYPKIVSQILEWI